jgi:hypothetical protein
LEELRIGGIQLEATSGKKVRKRRVCAEQTLGFLQLSVTTHITQTYALDPPLDPNKMHGKYYLSGKPPPLWTMHLTKYLHVGADLM